MSQKVKYVQCAHCPFRKDVNPHDIPDGYTVERHKALAETIAEPGSIAGVGRPMKAMACHESTPGKEVPCVGWMHQQLGPGNNIPLRLWAARNLRSPLRLVGEQHETFEDTLPPTAAEKTCPNAG